MESPRTSLWSRLVVYYSDHKPDQLKPEIMADIVEKYVSKEGELSARLRKKYGRPLPSEVSAQDLRRIMASFGLEDHDFRESCEHETLSSNKTPALKAGYGQLEAPRPSGTEAIERPYSWTGHQEAPPAGSALDFRSKYFDPLQALRHKTLRPPYPDEPVLDNLAKFRRLLPKIPPAATVAVRALPVVIGDGGADAFARQTQSGPATARDSAIPDESAVGWVVDSAGPGKSTRLSNTRDEGVKLLSIDDTGGGGDGRGVSSAGTTHPGGGSSAAQYRPPALRSAAELDKVDRELASRRRATDLESARSCTGADNLEEDVNPLAKIMKKYVGTGPYSLLYRLHDEKRRANVMIRRVNRVMPIPSLPDLPLDTIAIRFGTDDVGSIRGTCSGLIRAFDRHMNMLLVDVREDYTALVPVRDRTPSRARASSAGEYDQHSDGASKLPGVGADGWESEAAALVSRRIGSRGVPQDSEKVVCEEGDGEAGRGETGGDQQGVRNVQVSTARDAGAGDLAHAAESCVSTQGRTGIVDDRGGVDQGNRTADEDERGGTGRKRSSRRYRRKGARTGEVQLVRRRRFLKQLLIRGDNVVMVWEAPKYMP